ncbi:MAG: hypothetical protein H7Y59_13470 [Anaerolineales bacterium]|nr:hypothetical protein [Anaerolineales bacterium]
MTDLIRRLSLALLLFLLVFGVMGHVFSFANNASHISQESNCPIHGAIAEPKEVQPFTLKPAIAIGEIQDSTHALKLSVKISHPPTF